MGTEVLKTTRINPWLEEVKVSLVRGLSAVSQLNQWLYKILIKQQSLSL